MNDQAMKVLTILGDADYTDDKLSQVLLHLTDPEVLQAALKVRVKKLTTPILRSVFSNQNVTTDIINFAVDNAFTSDAAERAVNTNVSFRAKQALFAKLPHAAALAFMGDETILSRAQAGEMSAENLILAEKFIRVYGYDEEFAERWYDRCIRLNGKTEEWSSGMLTVYPAIVYNTANERILNAERRNVNILRNPNLSIEQAKAAIIATPEVVLYKERDAYPQLVQTLLAEIDNLPLQELLEGAAPQHLLNAARQKWIHSYSDNFNTAKVDAYEKNYNNLVARVNRTQKKVEEGDATQEALTLLEGRLSKVQAWRKMNAAVAHLS